MDLARAIAKSYATHDTVMKKGIGKRIRTKVKQLSKKIGCKRSVIKFLTMKREKQLKLLIDMRDLKDLKDEETQQAKKDAEAAKEESKRIRQVIDGLLQVSAGIFVEALAESFEIAAHV